MMIAVENIGFAYGNHETVFDDFSFTVARGEILAIIGPSGGGKTTLLYLLAGLRMPRSGRVCIDGLPLNRPRPGNGLVLQDHGLLPWSTVRDNVALGLKIRRFYGPDGRHSPDDATIDPAVADQKIAYWLSRLDIADLADKYPAQISRGQRQRTAIARSLVKDASLLLLDEPLSNLDAKLREELRFEIKSLVRRMGITAVYVTHDQAEAMVISDRIAVMDSGNVVQIGNPRDIYQEPANRFVADFIGTMNFMSGEVVAVMDDQSTVSVRTEFIDNLLCATPDSASATLGANVYASIRPEDVEVSTEPPQATENVFKGEIVHKAYLGNFLFFFVSVNDTMIRVQAPHYLAQEEGQEIFLYLNPQKCMILT